MKTLTKNDLTKTVMDNLGYSENAANAATTGMIAIMKEAIYAKNTVYVPKVLKIVSTIKAARPGRNPKTGELVLINRRHSIRAVRSRLKFPMAGKLTKSAFIAQLEKDGYSFGEATALVKTIYAFISVILSGNHRIEIRGFGVFSSTLTSGGIRRNPKTGESVNTKPKLVATFKCSDSLRRAMDNNYL